MRIFANTIVKRAFSSALESPAGDVYMWSDRAPAKLELPEKARRVSLGQNHSCIVGQSG
jgi:hypothetical protein